MHFPQANFPFIETKLAEMPLIFNVKLISFKLESWIQEGIAEQKFSIVFLTSIIN